jgi:hypothetical protein
VGMEVLIDFRQVHPGGGPIQFRTPAHDRNRA